MRLNLLKNRLSLYRRVKIDGKGLSSDYQLILTGVPCLCVPASERDNLGKNLTVGQDYAIHLNGSVDIREGDKVKVDVYPNEEFYISGVGSYVGVANLTHKTCLAQTRK